MPSANDTTSTHQALYTAVWCTTLLVNAINCALLGRTAYVQRTWPNVLSLALTIADVWVLTAGLLPAVIALFVDGLMERYSGLCSYQAVIINSWYIFAFFLMVHIILDRYIAVCHPFCYSRKIAGSASLKGIAVIIVLMAVTAVFFACLPLMLGRGFRVVPPGIYCFFDWASTEPKDLTVTVLNLAFIYAVLFTLTVLTIAVCAGIYQIVRSGRERTSDMPTNSGNRPTQSLMEVKFAKLGVVIAAVFCTCALPFSIVMIVQLATGHMDKDVDYIVLSVLLLNVAVNPLLHAVVRKPVRRAYLEMVKWALYGCCCGWKLLKPTKDLDNVLGIVENQPVISNTSSVQLTRVNATSDYPRHIAANEILQNQLTDYSEGGVVTMNNRDLTGSPISTCNNPVTTASCSSADLTAHSSDNTMAIARCTSQRVLTISFHPSDGCTQRMIIQQQVQCNPEPTCDDGSLCVTANSTFSYYAVEEC